MKDEKEQDLKVRTKAFALRIIRLYTSLPKTTEAQVLGKQVLRSGTSVGAHYREANRAKSDVDFIKKSKARFKNLTKPVTGLTFWSNRRLSRPKNSHSLSRKLTNSPRFSSPS